MPIDRRLLRFEATQLRRWCVRCLLLLGLAFPAGRAAGQSTAGPEPRWTMLTRLLVTGSSDRSEPEGFRVYSTFTLEAGLRRALGRRFAAELTLRTESREIDSLFPGGDDRRLGSLELLPIDLLLQWRLPTGGAIHPYAGAGANLTVAWEKSGLLDSTDMAGSVGPALGLGADLDLAPRALFSVDLKWNTMTATLDNAGTRLAKIHVDPLSVAIGAGFRF
jgi:outer membrane protein W